MRKRKHTTKTRRKMSDAQRERWANMSQEKRDAIRRKMSDTRLRKENALRWMIEHRYMVIDEVNSENKTRAYFKAHSFPNMPLIDSTPILELSQWMDNKDNIPIEQRQNEIAKRVVQDCKNKSNKSK